MNRPRIARMSPAPHRFSSLIATLASFGVLSGAGLAAQGAGSDSHFRGFEPTSDLLLVMGGQDKAAAEIFFSQGARSYLIISSDLPSPVLVNAGTESVETVQLMKVARQSDGSVDLLADATLASAGKYRMVDDEIELAVDGKSMRLKQRPWTVGLQNGADLLKSNSAYRYIAHSFHPDPGIIKRLKSGKEPVRILTFFGSWCPHCKRHLPLLLKTEQALAGSKIQFEYYGLPRPFDTDAGSEEARHRLGADGDPVRRRQGGRPDPLLAVVQPRGRHRSAAERTRPIQVALSSVTAPEREVRFCSRRERCRSAGL